MFNFLKKSIINPGFGVVGSIFPWKNPVYNLVESFVDNVIFDKVTPVRGSVVYCDLMGGHAEHSGIYVGDEGIVHLDGDGNINLVSPDVFLGRLGGFNMAISIYVSCKSGVAVGSLDVADRAIQMVGRKRCYKLLSDNCHQFTAGCLTGDFENNINYFTLLNVAVEKTLNGNSWRVWDRVR